MYTYINMQYESEFELCIILKRESSMYTYVGTSVNIKLTPTSYICMLSWVNTNFSEYCPRTSLKFAHVKYIYVYQIYLIKQSPDVTGRPIIEYHHIHPHPLYHVHTLHVYVYKHWLYITSNSYRIGLALGL